MVPRERAPEIPPQAPEVVTQRMVASVEQTWRAVFERAGERWSSPRVTFFDGPRARVCGSRTGAAVGVYCPPDRTIHFDRTAAATTPADEWWLVVAHEMGHHVQEIRGTFDATGSRVLDRPIDASPLQIREELQAECYSGVWAYGARAPRPDPGFFFRVDYRPGRATQTRRWFERGRRTGRPGLCDTFTPRDP